MALPLEGVTVLDLTQVLSGPFCTVNLGDLGADVIKIESFPGGDTTRAFDPKVNDESYCFSLVNRNKRSLAVNLKDPRGHAIVLALAREAEIVVENFRPDVKRKLKLDYDTIRALNPAVIYASISGFGQTGPYAMKGGYDIMAQGLTGIMRMTGEPDGRPAKVGIAMNDVAAGVTALYGILAAYIRRLRTGEGEYLETSLLEAGLAWSVWEAAAFFGSGELPIANGTRHRRSAPYQAFRTRDGYVTVGANTDKFWQAFCRDVIGRPEWIDDPRFADRGTRLAHVEALQDAIETVFVHETTAHWVERLDAAGVPAGPVLRYDETFEDPQVKARDMVVETEHPKMGRIRTFAPPIKSVNGLTSIRTPAPWLGQHTAEVLHGLGYTDGDIDALFAAGVVHDKYRHEAG
jgi:crotonobetainyl-CoA:carnitine CoA-transferase CaiB-like acyl-CoA transferase